MSNFLSVHTIWITLWNYPLSYLEALGVVFNAAGVYLMARKNILTWPVGIIGIVLFAFLFFQIRLYADFFEQTYYFVTSLYGWFLWTRKKERDSLAAQETEFSEIGMMTLWAVGTTLSCVVAFYLTTRLYSWFPQYFPEPASFPFWDSLTTVMSLAAQVLMIQKRTESWIYWIIVDVISVVIYSMKGIPFVALLYFTFLVMAVYGFWEWKPKKSAP